MNDYLAKCAHVLDPSARECYNKKLEHGGGFSKLPGLYFAIKEVSKGECS